MSFHRICLALVLVLVSCSFSWAAKASFSWLPNSERNIDSYRLYYGEKSRNYTKFVDVEPKVVNGRIRGAVVGLNDRKTYYFAVTAYSTRGSESNYSREIVVRGATGGGGGGGGGVQNPPPSGGRPPLEAGEVVINNRWKRVSFDSRFKQPVVIAKVISHKGADPCVVRVRNVGARGFDVRLQEWDYLDGRHGNEVVSYLVMEKGTYRLSDGTRIEAGRFTSSGTRAFVRHNFKQSYGSAPVVVTSIVTHNGGQAVTGRNKNVNRTGFNYLMQEQESNNDGHVREVVSYIAWQRSDGTVNGLTYSVGSRGGVGSKYVRAAYRAVKRRAFKKKPFVVTDMLTANGMDVGVTRSYNNSKTGIQIGVKEERSRDKEVWHCRESIGYIAVMEN